MSTKGCKASILQRTTTADGPESARNRTIVFINVSGSVSLKRSEQNLNYHLILAQAESPVQCPNWVNQLWHKMGKQTKVQQGNTSTPVERVTRMRMAAADMSRSKTLYFRKAISFGLTSSSACKGRFRRLGLVCTTLKTTMAFSRLSVSPGMHAMMSALASSSESTRMQSPPLTPAATGSVDGKAS